MRSQKFSLASVMAMTAIAGRGHIPSPIPSLFGASQHSHSYPNGPGWTQAQVQRMARKLRNVAKNRRAQRRAGR